MGNKCNLAGVKGIKRVRRVRIYTAEISQSFLRKAEVWRPRGVRYSPSLPRSQVSPLMEKPSSRFNFSAVAGVPFEMLIPPRAAGTDRWYWSPSGVRRRACGHTDEYFTSSPFFFSSQYSIFCAIAEHRANVQWHFDGRGRADVRA